MKKSFKKFDEVTFAYAFAMTNYVAMRCFIIIGMVASFVHIVQEILLAYEPMYYRFEDKMAISSYAMVHECVIHCMVIGVLCCVFYVVATWIDDFVKERKEEKLPE